jgi:exopolyphosphatase/guanosine-5'-triphosphate,3'-diphosphate pyrophosphatase
MRSAVPGGNDVGTTGASFERPAQASATSRRRRRGRWGHTYAALDLGTNNCRLLVARPTRGGFRVIDAFSRIVRLGEGLTGSGALSPAAQERTIAALRICAQKMERRGVTRRRLVATDACRRAANCEEFLARVAGETGLELEILSTSDEATLAVAGCAPLIDRRARHALVFDIGGGSTELTWVQVRRGNRNRTRVLDWTSLPCGVVNLAERYGGEAVAPEVYEAMIAEVRGHLAPFRDGLAQPPTGRPGEVQMLGTSGTVTTLGGVQLDLPYYDRNRVDGLWLDFDDALAIAERLRAMSFDERAAHPCIGRERADLVVAGCAILAAICRAWPVGRLRVADRGLREGMLLAMMRAADREVE